MQDEDRPPSKLKTKDRQLVENAVNAIQRHDHATLQELIPTLIERQLLNYRKAVPLDGPILIYAASPWVRNVEAAERLLDSGADHTVSDFKRATPLMKAASHSLALTRKLLRLGADCSATDSGGSCALHHAAHSVLAGCDILQELIQAGSDVNAIENAGRTPLHQAAASMDADKIRCLLRLGADPSIKARGSLGTPFDYLAGALVREQSPARTECLELLRLG